MKIGDRVFVRGYIDEIRKDTVIIRNAGGYFGTIPSEVITGELSSAQPEKRTEKRTETHACDCISRQAAIDALDEIESEVADGYGYQYEKWRKYFCGLPSAQPEKTEYMPDTKALPSKRDCVDLAERVTATFYDQEHEEWTQKTVTIAEVLDSVCDEYTILPSAQPESPWIPCSDQKRLPNYREPVLVSTYWGVRMAERDAVKEDGTDDFWYLFLDDATARPMYVYAWMPLPEPYKGEEE